MAKGTAKAGQKRRSRRAPYQGGAWAWGGCNPYRFPQERTPLEAAARAREIRAHWLPIAEARAAEGRRWYRGICAVYRSELAQLDAMIADAPQERGEPQKASAA